MSVWSCFWITSLQSLVHMQGKHGSMMFSGKWKISFFTCGSWGNLKSASELENYVRQHLSSQWIQTSMFHKRTMLWINWLGKDPLEINPRSQVPGKAASWRGALTSCTCPPPVSKVASLGLHLWLQFAHFLHFISWVSGTLTLLLLRTCYGLGSRFFSVFDATLLANSLKARRPLPVPLITCVEKASHSGVPFRSSASPRRFEHFIVFIDYFCF